MVRRAWTGHQGDRVVSGSRGCVPPAAGKHRATGTGRRDWHKPETMRGGKCSQKVFWGQRERPGGSSEAAGHLFCRPRGAFSDSERKVDEVRAVLWEG